MLPKEPCAVWQSEERSGHSRVLTLATIVAAVAYALIETCKMSDFDPQASLADILARLPGHPANKVVDGDLPLQTSSTRS